MSKVRIMSENLANKIAAGEVVERISSVVKELVENAIDAGAKTIKVELLDAGKKEIKVIDDGIGMDGEDAKNAFKRHATSKIYKDDDLFFINTLGFRGEALPSIASVSEVYLETYDGRTGTSVHIKGGEQLETGIAPSRQGTIITVSNLFYNTPARLKYMRNDHAELANVTQFMERLALSHPDIAFALVNNGAQIMRTSGSGNTLKAIHEIYGAQISSNMLEIKGSNDDYDVYGYISKPIVQRSTRNFMHTIINGRVIRNMELNKIINEAYYTYKPDSTYPVVVINIETDPTLIDVNIHPTKQDIKFSKMGELREVLTKAIKDALYSTILIPEGLTSKTETEEDDYDEDIFNKLPSSLFVRESESDLKPRFIEEKESIVKQEELDFAVPSKNEEIKALELYPVGIALGTYIIAENQSGVYLIDQHAAVERVNYEKVLKGFLSNERVPLLVPISFEFSSSEFGRIKSHTDYLESIGFELEEFGINTFRVKAHPAWVKKEKLVETTRAVFDLIADERAEFDPLKFNDKVAATIACKKSLKGNTRITLDLAKKILEELVLCDNPYNCPHGRPTIIKFTIYELEKMFKRAM